ncbi:hypothetical protein UPYG_G00350220 [Umbra pygmaea]|uniref:FH2 domain-containing protein n=1 Tax=Umbra pygmaea TaxID=75934 RepID=A0ABD0W2M0_UMBPY
MTDVDSPINTDTDQGKTASNTILGKFSTIFTRSNRHESQTPEESTVVQKFFLTLSDVTDMSNPPPGNTNDNPPGKPNSTATATQTNEREELCQTKGCREMESMRVMPPVTDSSVECDRHGGVLYDIMEEPAGKDDNDANSNSLNQSHLRIIGAKPHLQGCVGSTDLSEVFVSERTSFLYKHIGSADSGKQRVSMNTQRNGGGTESCGLGQGRSDTSDSDTHVTTDCTSTDQSETTDHLGLCDSTCSLYPGMLTVQNKVSDDRTTVKEVQNHLGDSNDTRNVGQACDAVKGLANPSAAIAGKPSSMNNRTVIITMSRIETLLKEQSTRAESEAVVGTARKSEESGPGEGVEGKGSINSHLPLPTGPRGMASSAGSGPPLGTTSTRATFSPGSPVEKPLQLPAFLSILRIPKKVATGPDQNIVTPIKPASSTGLGKPLKKEQKTGPQRQDSFLDQLSQFLKIDQDKEENSKPGELKEKKEPEESEESKQARVEPEKWREEKENTEGIKVLNTGEELTKTEQDENTIILPAIELSESSKSSETLECSEPLETPKSPLSSAEMAFDAFKAFFTPKPLKRDGEKEGLDAVKRKAWIFERTSKTPEKNTNLESENPGDGDDRSTPGRLHAIWPPTKEEKVGLKYTEAEHQAALLQLKRECKEEVEKLQEDFGKQLRQVRGDSEEHVYRLEHTVARLQRDLALGARHQHGETRDVAVSTGDDLSPRAFRTVCVQTDRHSFIRTPENEDGGVLPCLGQRLNAPKRLDLCSISLSLSGQGASSSSVLLPPTPPTFTNQTQGLDGLPTPPVPLPISGQETPPPPPPPPGCGPPPPPQGCSPPPPPPGCGPPPPPPPPGCGPPPPPPPGCGPPPPPPPPGCGPPPPPPPPGCGPPPPPPPPGCGPPPPGGLNFNALLDKPPRKPVVEPNCPMKPLYWTRIQTQDNSGDTLWNSLEEPDIINTTEFEDLFSKTTAKTKRKPLAEAYEKKAKSKKIVKLLDGKRSQAVGILISSLHLEMKDILQAVLTVDNTIVDVDTIQALYDNRAQPDELERIKKHYESPEDHVKFLDKPEQFLYELSQIPDFPDRASCIIFQSVFKDGITSIRSKVDVVFRVCKDLLETSSVREVMGLILALGNHMNGGNRTRGQADGFGLEILPKLKDVKSRDNRITLVDYVVSYYLHNLDENAGTDRSVFPLPDPQQVFQAAQVKFEDVNKDLRQLRRDLTVCEKSVQKVCLGSSEEHLQPFKDKMEVFVLIARKELNEADAQLMFARKRYQDLGRFLGLKPKIGETEVETGHLFMLWFEFCADFKTRWKRENKNISKERLKEAQLSVKKITADKMVETRKINPNSLKERLRQKEASIVSTS